MEDNAVLRKESPTDKPPREPWSKKTKIIVWSVVGVIVVAAIVLGIVFGVRGNAYKMRTFKKDGDTYEQYNIEAKSDGTTYMRTPRGVFPFYANYDVNENPESQFSYLMSGGPERYEDYRVILSKSIKNTNPKIKQQYITHAVVWENDNRNHYYEMLTQAKYSPSQKALIKKFDKAKDNERIIVTKKAPNKIVTGIVQFDPDVLLYVDKGIVTGYQINGKNYYFSYD